MNVKRHQCDFCNLRCGILVTMDDAGNMVHFEGDPACPEGQGFACERIHAIPDFHNNERRLNYPMKRTGGRGENKWERVSWDQALDEIAAKVLEIKKEYGPEAVGSIGGTMHGCTDDGRFRFLNLFGSPNGLCQGRNCGSATINVGAAMFGWDIMMAGAVPGVTKTLFVPGANPAESNPMAWGWILEAQKQGMKMVVIDPRLTETASHADLWLQLRPGTDGALFWGMVKYVIDKDLVDHDFIDNWTLGYDMVVEEAKNWSLERSCEITGVPEWQIAKAAEWYSEKPSAIMWGLSSCHLGAGAESAVHAMYLLPAIVGQLDLPGGQIINGPGGILQYYEVLEWDTLINHPERTKESLTAHKFITSVAHMARYEESIRKVWKAPFPMAPYLECPSPKGFYDAILKDDPYPLRALLIVSGSPLSALTGGKHAYEAMKSEKLELSVGMDFFMTPSMALCDYVLPAQDFTEKDFMMGSWGWPPLVTASRKLVEPIGERKDDYWFFKELGVRCGQQGWPEDLVGFYDLELKPSKVTWAELADREYNFIYRPPYSPEGKHYLKIGFGTPSGKVELAPSLLAASGRDPLPKYTEPGQSPVADPELAKNYPFTMIAGHRVRPYHHTEFRELKAFRATQPYPFVEIHPTTARRLGIGHEDWVYIETPLGRVRQKARIMPTVKEDVIAAEAYWYYPEMPAEEPWLLGAWESNPNTIMPDDYELCSFAGDQPMRVVACNIYKADAPAIRS
jgi:thiosulfate reductase / polysulfide reductase chain A